MSDLVTKYDYITHTEALKELLVTWSNIPAIYIDLEFDKNHFRYGFNLCLIQVYDKEKTYLIDPLSEHLNLSDFFQFLANENCKKVCFAFSEDLRLFHHLGCFPKNICDLSVAKSLLGMPSISLENILIEKLGIQPAKSQQKSNWFERPLTKEQKYYASEDVCYLAQLEEVIMEELKQLDRLTWFEEEMQFLNNQNYSDDTVLFSLPEKERKNFKLGEWMRYAALLEWREKQAESLGRPSFKVIDKNLLISIAKKERSIHNWKEFRGIHPSLKSKKAFQEVKLLLEQVQNQIVAENINTNQPAKNLLPDELRSKHFAIKSKIDRYKKDFFIPLKNGVATCYGEHFTNFILSNRIIEHAVLGKFSFLNYQKEIFRNILSEQEFTEKTIDPELLNLIS